MGLLFKKCKNQVVFYILISFQSPTALCLFVHLCVELRVIQRQSTAGVIFQGALANRPENKSGLILSPDQRLTNQ